MCKVMGNVVSSHPLITVLMSVYNDERYLSQAITSILNQSLTDFEFIIIDDGSTDTSWEILTMAANQDARILLWRNDSNLGLPVSLNRGLALVKGKYIARMDADDVAHSERLAKELATFEGAPGLVLVGSSYWVINEDGQIMRKDCPPIDDTSIRWQMLFHNSFSHSAVMMRADVLAAHGLRYNEECRYAQDYELWSRLLDHGSSVNCTEPLISYRLRDSNQRINAYLEQQAIATRIAIKNIDKLGIRVSEHEMDCLRNLYNGQMSMNHSINMRSYYLLLQILSVFSKNKMVNRLKLSFIRLDLFREVVMLKQSNISVMEKSKIAWAIFSVDVLNFVFAVCLTALDKAKKNLLEHTRHLEGGGQQCP